jgi:1-acyl-sn-glycerol-3-phosphate acyltransferase
VFKAARILGKPYLNALFRLETEGAANLPQRDGLILLAKHQRWEDIPLLAMATPRPLTFVAKYELFTSPLSDWFISSLGGLPLNRSRPMESRQSLKAMMEILRNGEGIAIFPEGTYYRDRMGPGQPGLIRMIGSRLRVPFVPVGINYRQERRRTRVLVRFGEPICKDPATSPRAFLGEVMLYIKHLSGLVEKTMEGERQYVRSG